MPADNFARERLGMWLDEEDLLDLPIDKYSWEACGTEQPNNDGIVCYGVKFDLTGSNAAVTACVKNKESFHIELVDVYDTSRGMQQLIEFMEIAGKKAAQIIIDGKGTSYDLQQRLLKISIPKSAIMITNSTDLTNACSMLASAVVAREITHYSPQQQLTDSAITCTRRNVGNNGA